MRSLGTSMSEIPAFVRPDVAAHFASLAKPEWRLGRVFVQHQGLYGLMTASGEQSAVPAGALRHAAGAQADLPVVGDWVAYREVGGLAQITALLPRWSEFRRRRTGPSADDQVLAANVDCALLLCGLDHDYNRRRLERYWTLARDGGAQPVVVLTKADLDPRWPVRRDEVAAALPGTPVVAVSVHEAWGVEEVRGRLGTGETAVLLGSSGAGKSTLLNALLGQERQRTQPVRLDDSRGRHTTTHRELFLLPDGAAVIDCPGLRTLALPAGVDNLDDTFAEVTERAQQCRYRDCQHDAEPGCAVRAAVEAGEMSADRLAHYGKLRRELHHEERQADSRLAREEKRRVKVIHRAMRRGKKA